MAIIPGDSTKDQHAGQSSAQGQSNEKPGETPTKPSPDRAELLARARTFLSSPQVQLQDSDAKRAFLAEKGLSSSEVDQLLRELLPPVPPRTYPAQPPSSLPYLLAGVLRILTWLTGASAVVLFVYYKFFLPRLAQSYQSRLALRRHQSALFTRLTDSASALKATQAESYKDLPRTVPVYEDPRYAQCHSIDQLLSHVKNSRGESTEAGVEIPDVTIIRCALQELDRSRVDGTSTEELFRHLEAKLPWLDCKNAARQTELWNQLNDCPLFVSSVLRSDAITPLPLDHPSHHWKYVPPAPFTSSLFVGMTKLQAAFPRSRKVESTSFSSPPPAPPLSARQRTLQVLSDFTGYITTQTYAFGLPSIRGAKVVGGNPIEDELRCEIRALKGLVLNRKTFLPFGAGTSGWSNNPPSDA